MKYKKAFTMIELIVVIVVMGILAAYSIPRLKRDTRSEAINHILTMIRYTQNLALHDSKHSFNNTLWQRSFWRFNIYNCKNGSGLFYTIGTDSDFSKGIKRGQSAIDPANNRYTTWDTRNECPPKYKSSKSGTITIDEASPNIFLTYRYNIKSVNFSCKLTNKSSTSTSKYIAFDNLGRPIKAYNSNKPDYSGHIVGNCKVKFTFNDNSINPFTIIIPAESGFAYLEENPSL